MKRYIMSGLLLAMVIILTACGSNKIVADGEYTTATFLGAERTEDKVNNYAENFINFNLTNKAEDAIRVQAKDVMIDGKPVENLTIFKEDIAGESNVDAQMYMVGTIDKLPKLGKMTFTLLVMNPFLDNDILEEIDISVNL